MGRHVVCIGEMKNAHTFFCWETWRKRPPGRIIIKWILNKLDRNSSDSILGPGAGSCKHDKRQGISWLGEQLHIKLLKKDSVSCSYTIYTTAATKTVLLFSVSDSNVAKNGLIWSSLNFQFVVSFSQHSVWLNSLCVYHICQCTLTSLLSNTKHIHPIK
jgi:hypothetical protein